LVPFEKRIAYGLPEIKKWLELFLLRFFKLSQFKRSAIPNGPKVGSGGSLSPRGDWRAPSDAEAELWLKELREHVPGTDSFPPGSRTGKVTTAKPRGRKPLRNT
jgi:NAD+ synthase (glutamine-hydrolysing)